MANENKTENKKDWESIKKTAEELEKMENKIDPESPLEQELEQEADEGIGEMQARIIDLQEQLASQQEAVLRERASTENIKRRTKLDIEKAHKRALEKFVSELLPVADSMERGLEGAEGSTKDGLELTYQMLLKACEKFGVKQLNPIGEVFSPSHHEAMTMAPNPELEDNTVLEVIQRGYELNGHLVRPARVIVVKN